MAFKSWTFFSATIILCVVLCLAENQTQTNVTEPTTTTLPDQKMDNGDDFNQTEIMMACNETFHTEMSWYYLELSAKANKKKEKINEEMPNEME